MQWRLKDQEAYQVLNTTGTLKRLQEELDLIKEKYAMSDLWICHGKTLYDVPRNTLTVEEVCTGIKKAK